MLPKVKVKVPLYKVKRTYFKEIDGWIVISKIQSGLKYSFDCKCFE